MRLMPFILFTGALVGGCRGTETIRAPTEPSQVTSLAVSLSSAATLQDAGVAGLLDDAIDRLVPALGPRGAALGAPLRHLRDGDYVDPPLIDATLRQLAALSSVLPPETVPDATALELALVALGARAGK
jgi:hypothetical protein